MERWEETHAAPQINPRCCIGDSFPTEPLPSSLFLLWSPYSCPSSSCPAHSLPSDSLLSSLPFPSPSTSSSFFSFLSSTVQPSLLPSHPHQLPHHMNRGLTYLGTPIPHTTLFYHLTVFPPSSHFDRCFQCVDLNSPRRYFSIPPCHLTTSYCYLQGPLPRPHHLPATLRDSNKV